jgi:hypothetical protein
MLTTGAWEFLGDTGVLRASPAESSTSDNYDSITLLTKLLITKG